MASTPEWPVVFQDDFALEFAALERRVQYELVTAIRAVQIAGPFAGRPHVGTLVNPRHPNMKELRFEANDGLEVWRAAFAFDPQRRAVVLVAADKQGMNQARFYARLLAKANQRYDAHLEDMRGVDTGGHTGRRGRS